MWLPAHIGKVPVEEWLPFLAPLVALFLYGRHHNRRQERALARLPPIEQALDERAVRLVLEQWSRSHHEQPTAEHVPLFYPPGPDGASARELASRTRRDPRAVERQLEDLQELDYVDLDRGQGGEPRAWLTAEGFSLLTATEQALLAAHGIEPPGRRRRARLR